MALLHENDAIVYLIKEHWLVGASFIVMVDVLP